MSTLRILHAADLHLDSPFEGLPSGKAAMRRSEQRELLSRLVQIVRTEGIDLVLLAGDLLDSGNTYYETGEELVHCLSRMPVPVFIAPGNHDFYNSKSPYARLKLPENVYIFRDAEIECAPYPELGFRVFGAAFTDRSSLPLLSGFSAKKAEGMKNIMCLHGEVGVTDSVYDPISLDDIAASGMDYIALGHIHRASGLQKAGDTWYSWPGCPEGRGFDECGEKTVNIVSLHDDGSCALETRSIALRRYEQLKVDVTGFEPLLAIHTALPDDTVKDIYRITLTGQTDSGINLNRIYAALEELFFQLQLRDETGLRTGLWERAGEDTLRGIFLKKLKAKYDAERDEARRRTIEQAAKWGLAALDNMEEVVRHEDK